MVQGILAGKMHTMDRRRGAVASMVMLLLGQQTLIAAFSPLRPFPQKEQQQIQGRTIQALWTTPCQPSLSSRAMAPLYAGKREGRRGGGGGSGRYNGDNRGGATGNRRRRRVPHAETSKDPEKRLANLNRKLSSIIEVCLDGGHR